MSWGARYQVTVEGHVFDVTLEPGEGGLAAQVGDERWSVGWHERGSHARTLVVGETALAALVSERADEVWVALEGYQAEVQVAEARALRLAASLPARAARSEREEIRAPMPGRVVSVRVAAGDPVERGTLVAVLEAMKMENELRAPQPGRVAEVRAAEGDTVEHGALLVLLEPLAQAPAGGDGA
jgi:biotin carboxyl carrier protein